MVETLGSLLLTPPSYGPVEGDRVSPFSFPLEGLKVDLAGMAETATFNGRLSLPTH